MNIKIGDVVKFKSLKGLESAVGEYGTFGIGEVFIWAVAGLEVKVTRKGMQAETMWFEFEDNYFSWPYWFLVEKKSKKK